MTQKRQPPAIPAGGQFPHCPANLAATQNLRADENHRPLRRGARRLVLPGAAARLPYIVGRAFTPAGEAEG